MEILLGLGPLFGKNEGKKTSELQTTKADDLSEWENRATTGMCEREWTSAPVPMCGCKVTIYQGNKTKFKLANGQHMSTSLLFFPTGSEARRNSNF